MKRIIGMPFLLGVVSHLLFWVVAVNFDSVPLDMVCGETSCWILFFAEFPFSLFYISGSAIQVTVASLVVGSVWWGVAASFLVLVARRLKPKLLK
jgi:hypothetical protein